MKRKKETSNKIGNFKKKAIEKGAIGGRKLSKKINRKNKKNNKNISKPPRKHATYRQKREASPRTSCFIGNKFY